MPKRVSKNAREVNHALTALFEEALYEILIAMVKSEPYEAAFAGFREEARRLTTDQLRRIAKYAAEYYVLEAGPSPGDVPRERVESLKKRSIAHALKRLNDEAN
jgi:hypothetical protein